MKLVLKIVGVLVVVVLIAGGGCLLYINSIAKGVIEAGGQAALGVETTLEGINIGILGGTVSLAGLEIANPQGYETAHFMVMKEASTGIRWGSLRGDVVEVPHLRLRGLNMNLEKRKGKANYAVLLDNLAEFTGGTGGDEDEKKEKSPKDETSGKRFVIRELTIEDVTVTVELLPIGGSLVRRPVTIKQITLKDVGSGSDKGVGGVGGVGVAEVMGAVVRAVLEAVVKTGVDVPLEIVNDLGGHLENLGSVGVEVVGVVADQAGKAVGTVAEKTGEAVKGVAQGVGNLLGGLGKKKDKAVSEEATPEEE